MTAKALAVAQRMLEECGKSEPSASVTPMQLIKLVYIAHGYMLGRHGKPLLDEPVQAWQYGPVVKSVYNAVREDRSAPVKAVRGAGPHEFTPEEAAVIRHVAQAYGRFDGITLSSATHKPDTPWHVTWTERGQNSPIPDDLIENFYRMAIMGQPRHSSL
jgi:uncharacterized phage-associated protein